MIITAKVKLLPSPEQTVLLREVMERVNAACNWISGEAWEHKTFGQYHLHHLVYYPTREQFALPSKLTVRAIAKVADAYKLDKKTCRTFRKDGAIDYENGCLRWWIDRGEVSLLTLAGRECIPFVCGPRQAELLLHRQGQSSLATADGKFYLIACCNVDTPDPQRSRNCGRLSPTKRRWPGSRWSLLTPGIPPGPVPPAGWWISAIVSLKPPSSVSAAGSLPRLTSTRLAVSRAGLLRTSHTRRALAPSCECAL